MDGEIAIEQARNNDKVLKNSTSNQTLVESDDKADSLNSNSLHENGPQKNKKSIKKIEKLKKLKDELATVKTENEIFKQSLFERDEIIKKLATEKEKYLKKISLMEESAEFQREEYLSMVSAENEPVENASTRKLSEALKTSDDEHQKNLHREEFNYVKNQLKDNLDLVKTLSSSSNELKSANANLEKELNLKNENESELQKRVVDLKSINLSIENENNDLKKQIENLIFRHNDDVNKQLTADSQNRKIIFGLKSTVARLEDLIKKNEKNIAGSGDIFKKLDKGYWVVDSTVNECQDTNCNYKFGLFHRRHHCRKCGSIFCFDHVKRMIKLNLGTRTLDNDRGYSVKCCEKCFIDVNSTNENSPQQENRSMVGVL